MPVLSDFSPQGAPGETGRAYIDSRNASESWMDRAQNRKASEQNMELQRQQIAMNAILLPVKQATAEADLVKAKTDLDGAVQTQGTRKGAYALLDEARQNFDFINLIPDDKVRARASREWLSRYSQLQNIAELKDEMSVKNHLATSNILDAQKIDMLGGIGMQAFNELTADMTPEEKKQAAKVKVGLEGRKSGAAIQYKEVVGPNGEKRLVAVDPRAVGAQVVDSGESFGSGVSETPESQRRAAGEQQQSRSLTGQTTKEEATAKNEAEYQQKLVQTKPKRQAALQQAEANTERLSSDIDELISKVTTATAGPGGVILDQFPGTTARDLQSNLDSIKANVGFATLQAMREASPTGGALGQVSDVENKLLQSTLASLQLGQSPAQLISNLKKVKQRFTENYGIARSAFQHEFGEDAGNSAAPNWDESKEKRLQELKAKLGK